MTRSILAAAAVTLLGFLFAAADVPLADLLLWPGYKFFQGLYGSPHSATAWLLIFAVNTFCFFPVCYGFHAARVFYIRYTEAEPAPADAPSE